MVVAGERLYIDGGSLEQFPKYNFSEQTIFKDKSTITRYSVCGTCLPWELQYCRPKFRCGVTLLTSFWPLPVDTRTAWIDLKEPFNHTNFKLHSSTKPLEACTENGQVFVSKISEDKFYVFGGTYPKYNQTSELYQEPPERNTGDLWSYTLSTGIWYLETPDQSNFQRITDGAGTIDYHEGVFYYAQGRYTNEVVWDFPDGELSVDGLLSLHMTDKKPVWKNESILGGASVTNGYLEYVPLGKRGVLISFGEVRLPKGTLNGAGILVSTKSTNRNSTWVIDVICFREIWVKLRFTTLKPPLRIRR